MTRRGRGTARLAGRAEMPERTFSAPSAAEALLAARAELGEGACVIETRRSEAGVEVVVATSSAGLSWTPGPSRDAPDIGAAAEPLLDELLGRGFSPVLAERIARAASANLDPEQLADRGSALAYARELVALWLPAAPPSSGRDGRLLVVVGSPGVGKTTTTAKIAAHELVARNRRLVLASADDRRLGGAEQLEAYARVFGVSFRAIRDRRDLHLAREAATSRGTLLVDTPGIARGDAAGLQRLVSIFADVRPDEIELLLAADREAESLADTVRRFSVLRPGVLGATRTDEALRPGVLLSALTRAGRPLRHLGTGPDVPEDLEDADSRRLAAWALPPPAPDDEGVA